MMTPRFSYEDNSSGLSRPEALAHPEGTIFRVDPAETSEPISEVVDEIAAAPALDLDEVAPHAVHIPMGYEPKYAYPLIVWLQPTGFPEPNLQQIMPVLSERNYIGMTARLRFSIGDLNQALHLAPEGQAGSVVPWNWLEDLKRDVLQVRRSYHVHSERIYLAGVGKSALAAIQLLLERPEWLAGAIALDPDLEEMPFRMHRFGALTGKRLLTTAVMKSDKLAHLQRLCFTAGMHVAHRSYSTEHSIHRRVLRDIDHWIMAEVCQPQMV